MLSKKLIKFWGKHINKGLIILFIIVLAICVMFFLANLSLKNSVKNVEKDRDESMIILKKSFENNNQVKVKAQQLFTSTKLDYRYSDDLYNDIQNLTIKSSKLDKEFVINGQKQRNDFKPILTFMLSKNKKNQIVEINKSLETEDKNCVASQNNNINQMYALLPIVRSLVDLIAAGDALSANNINNALASASPLQRYTRQSFSFDNESLVKTSNPGAYDAMQNSKKYFADLYNYLLLVNSGKNQEANNLWSGLGSQLEVVVASIDNAMKDKNPLSEDFYQSEIAGIEQYINALDSLGISYNKGRETAYYTLQSIEYYNHRENKYPRVSDFNALKQTLNLKYGSSDFLKYSSSDDISYTVEYLEKGKWVKIENKVSDSSTEIQSESI